MMYQSATNLSEFPPFLVIELGEYSHLRHESCLSPFQMHFCMILGGERKQSTLISNVSRRLVLHLKMKYTSKFKVLCFLEHLFRLVEGIIFIVLKDGGML